MDCLKFLVKLCSDLGLKESQEYSLKLKKAEKMLETKRQVNYCFDSVQGHHVQNLTTINDACIRPLPYLERAVQ